MKFDRYDEVAGEELYTVAREMRDGAGLTDADATSDLCRGCGETIAPADRSGRVALHDPATCCDTPFCNSEYAVQVVCKRCATWLDDHPERIPAEHPNPYRFA